MTAGINAPKPSRWRETGHYDLWYLDETQNWVKFAAISFMSTTKEEAIAHAEKFVREEPTQLLHVLPAKQERVALWINGTRANLTDLP